MFGRMWFKGKILGVEFACSSSLFGSGCPPPFWLSAVGEASVRHVSILWKEAKAPELEVFLQQKKGPNYVFIKYLGHGVASKKYNFLKKTVQSRMNKGHAAVPFSDAAFAFLGTVSAPPKSHWEPKSHGLHRSRDLEGEEVVYLDTLPATPCVSDDAW